VDEKEDEQEKPTSVVGKGAKWGMIVGFVIAQIFISTHSPLGFYTGNMGLVYLTCIGLATGIGALFAWLSTMRGDDE
jgi:hypothetical protein